MRKRDSYIRKYGATLGNALYVALQREAAMASVAARLKKKIVSTECTKDRE